MNNFAKYFDHTILAASTTPAELKRVCDEARANGFCSVAVNTGMVKLCADYLKGSDVLVDAAVGFPLGITTVECKLFEAEEAMRALAKKAKVELPDSIESKIRTLKQKQPQGFAELLEEEDPRAAAAKLMNLAKESGVELFPAGMMNRRRPGMDKEAPAQKEQSMRRPGRVVNMAKLRKLYPEEMQKLEELRTSDPAAYKAGLVELSKKMKKDAKKAASEK